MKFIPTSIIAVFLFFFHTSHAQYLYNCDGSRYLDSLFSVTKTAEILYGHNNNYAGTGTDLHMDVYEPTGDTAFKRPLIIFAPKGSFLSEDKAELTMVQLCNHFASRGYVAVAIDYRVGVNYSAVMADPDREFTYAVLRAYHDYKAAIRYFRKDAVTSNTFRIDTNVIIAGGSSAGAITALHVAFLDQESEVPTFIDTTGLGGLEGLSGNPGYSSEVNYVVNLCGAIADTNWIVSGDQPVISMHGNLDTEVPYGTATITMGIPIMEVDGSASIAQRAQHIGLNNPFHTFWGKTHIPYDINAGGNYLMYMDTVKNYVTSNLYTWLCGVTSGDNAIIKKETFSFYPNPVDGKLTVSFSGSVTEGVISITDMTGKPVYTSEIISSVPQQTIDLSLLKPGIYILSLTTDKTSGQKKLVIQ